MAKVLISERLTDAPFFDLLHRKFIAIKTFIETPDGTTLNPKIFEHELKIWINLDNPNIVPLQKIIVLRNNLLAIMPYYENNLRELLEKKIRVNANEAITILLQILNGLYYAHKEFGIIHQDIKPENILSNDNSKYLVSDWGISNLQNYYHPMVPDSKDKQSQYFLTLSKMGTLPYISPERLLRHPSDIRSDIYSVGVMFFEMLSGHLPFDFSSSKRIEYQIIEADYYDVVGRILSEYSNDRIMKVILNCIEPQINNRCENYSYLIKELKRILKRMK